tara:strand:+ start:136 stop:396 length:261 start_codon:yes stop_codon:yes gene_type:complete
MREFTEGELQEIFNIFETHKRKYQQMVADLNHRIIIMGKQGNLTGSLKLSSEVSTYRERIGYCVGVLAMIRWIMGGHRPNMNPTRR